MHDNAATSIERISGLLDALQCGAMLMDRGGRILHANKRLCELAGRSCAQLRGLSLCDLYTSEDGRAVIGDVLSHFDEPIEREFFIPRPDGTRVPVITAGRPLEGAGGPACHRVVTIIDISERKRAEERSAEAFREVARLSDTVLEQALELRGYSRDLEQRVRQRTAELRDANVEAIYMLAVASEAKDADTGAHVRRIERLARLLALAAGLSEAEAAHLGHSAILHDVGKMHVPDELLKRPGPLTPEEWGVMRLHTVNGERILSRKPFFEVARRIARSHHENWDGSGYPDGLCGEAIPREARIVRLVDVFDALTTARPYKAAWPLARAVAELRAGAGEAFEPRLVDAFLPLLESGVVGAPG